MTDITLAYLLPVLGVGRYKGYVVSVYTYIVYLIW
nr:MAG TPA: hypothetical protein [Bacteriophage sp.]